MTSGMLLLALLGGVLVVDDDAGPFLDVQDAVDAASEGDVVLVKEGVYSPVTVAGKGVAIVAETGAIVSIVGGATITGTAAGQPVLLSGLRVAGKHTRAAGDALIISDTAGPVRIEGCFLFGAAGIPHSVTEFGGEAVEIDGASDVAFLACTLRGGDGTFSIPGFEANRGGHALRAHVATVVTLDSAVLGGDGGPGDFVGCDYGGVAGDGARLTDSTLVAAGGGFSGGDGGGDDFFACNPGGDGIRATGAGTAVFVLDIEAVGGLGACGLPDGLGVHVEDGALLTSWEGTARKLDATVPVRSGDPATLAFTGEAGDDVLLVLSAAPAYTLVPAWRGALLLLPPLVGPLAFGALPPSGTLAVDIVVPPLPVGIDGLVAPAQAAFVDVAGAVRLGGATSLVLLAPGV